MSPSKPSNAVVIREVTPAITTLSIPFAGPGGAKFGGRATIVRLQTGSLAVFSPIALSPEILKRVESLGTVRYIAALNIEHHLFISVWAKQFPEAEVIGMAGLPEKREQNEATKGIKFSHVFTAEGKQSMSITPEFDEEFEYEYLHSHQNKELVFMHKPSGTLIEADLLFNLPATEQYSKTKEGGSSGLLTKFVGHLLNTKGDFIWQKRIIWYVAGAKDRTGFAQSVAAIQSWDFSRIIPCHGDVIETEGKVILERATEWFKVLI